MPPFSPGATTAWLGNITVADTNGDKIPDIIDLGPGYVNVEFGNGNGAFRAGPNSQTGTGYTVFPLATDVNGDGSVDLISSGQANFGDTYYGVAVSLGKGDGSFQPAVFYQTGADTELGNVVYGDFNGEESPI